MRTGYCARLCLHVHLHVLWPAGGLALDGTGWRSLPGGCCLPTAWLVDEFRTRFLNGLQKAYEQDKLVLRDRHGQLLAAEAFAEWLETLRTCYWNLHAKPVDMGTAGLTRAAAAERTLKYLAGYAKWRLLVRGSWFVVRGISR
ncbi:MAG: transposase [Pirellulaceae bacterium]